LREERRNMSLIEINWRPNRRELRIFGLSFLAAFGVLGALVYFAPPPVWWEANRNAGALLWVTGGAGGLLGLTGSRAALPVYWAWMGLSFVLGSVMSRLVMAFVFFGVITPIGLIMRLVGRDPLRRKKPRSGSYWVDVEPADDISRYERQF